MQQQVSRLKKKVACRLLSCYRFSFVCLRYYFHFDGSCSCLPSCTTLWHVSYGKSIVLICYSDIPFFHSILPSLSPSHLLSLPRSPCSFFIYHSFHVSLFAISSLLCPFLSHLFSAIYRSRSITAEARESTGAFRGEILLESPFPRLPQRGFHYRCAHLPANTNNRRHEEIRWGLAGRAVTPSTCLFVLVKARQRKVRKYARSGEKMEVKSTERVSLGGLNPSIW